jgi:hypothetical protein
VRAWSVLVVLGCDIDVRQKPANLTLLRGWQLVGWLRGLPQTTLSTADVLRLERSARTRSTWPTARPACASAGSAKRSSPTSPPAAPASASVTVRRWKRFGMDRLYANGVNFQRLWYLDIVTGEIVLEVTDPSGAVTAQLRASHGALGTSTPPDGR